MNPHDYGDDYFCRTCGQSAFFDFDDTECASPSPAATPRDEAYAVEQPDTCEHGERPEAAPYVVMDQRGNYWRVFSKGTLLGADEDMWSMCPVSSENYVSEPVVIYRQGRDLSAADAQDMLIRIEQATDDQLLLRAARSAWQAWITGRDMVTEAELLLQGVEIRVCPGPVPTGQDGEK